MSADLIARLRAVENRLAAAGDIQSDADARTVNEALTAMQEGKALRERVRELEKALEPFAEDYEKRSRLAPGPDIDHWPIGGSSLTYGHLRGAYELIHPQIEGDEQ